MDNDNKEKKSNKLKIILFIVGAILLALIIIIITLNSIHFFNNEKKDNNTTNTNNSNNTSNEVPESTYLIKEDYVVEVGSLLPSIDEYYYSCPPDFKGEIKYYLDDEEVSVEDITNTIDGIRYLKEVNVYHLVVNNIDKTILKVVDTTIPTVTLQEVTIKLGDTYDLNSFILEYKDNSNTKEYTINLIDNSNEKITKEGTYNIKLQICDLYNNCVDKEAKLIVNKKENSSNNSSSTSKPNNNSSSSSNKNNSSSGSSSSGSNSSGNSSGNSSSGGNSSGNSSSGGGTSEKPSTGSNKTYVDTKIENVVLKTETKYGTKIIYSANITYKIYSDGSKEEVSRSSTFIDYDSAGYNGTTSQLKSEAVSLYSSQESSRNTILNKTNEYRQAAGVAPLTLDKDLSIIATIKAIELAYSGVFDHDRPDGKKWTTIYSEYFEGTKPTVRITAENIAYNYTNDLAACNQWRNSQGHYENMIYSVYTKIGIGKYTLNGRIYYVQEFGI